MKLSNYVAEFLSKLSPRCFTVCGAGAMHLNDSICHHPGIKAIAMHHEQAAAFAAEADARVTNNIGVVCVTAGPGGSNTLTGVSCAWVDSIPMLVIAGQVTSSTMAKPHAGERAQGMNELPMTEVMRPVTKYARTVWDATDIRYTLERAVHEAMSGRRGPVWIEIPLDIQNAEINPDRLPRYHPEIVAANILGVFERVSSLLSAAERPVLVIGNGVRLSGAEEALAAFLERYEMPVVTSWGARDIIPGHGIVIGSAGLFGNRAANEAVQGADLILAVGTRLSYPQTGHHRGLFAPNAKKIVVDIDHQEASKLKPDLAIAVDCKAFFERVMETEESYSVKSGWLYECAKAAATEGSSIGHDGDVINAYHFIEQLSEHLADDAIVITDVGFSFIPTFQTLKLKPGQRLIHSHGCSPMGWAIPAAVGAAFAAPGRQIVCLTGDGGAMMNIQELQTIAHHKLPISIFVYANGGYATMILLQENHFGRLAVSGPKGGVSCPDFEEVANAFGMKARNIVGHHKLDEWLAPVKGPFVGILHMAPSQVIAPRVQSRMKDGKFIPTPIDEMWPPLERPEAAE